MRGAGWEQGEQALAQQRWWASQKLPSQVVGSELGARGLRGESLGPTEMLGTLKVAPTGGEDPKRYLSMSIIHYLCLVHWE